MRSITPEQPKFPSAFRPKEIHSASKFSIMARKKARSPRTQITSHQRPCATGLKQSADSFASSSIAESERALAAPFPDVMTPSKIENQPANSTQVKRRVLIVDDHPVFRHGITALINAEQDLMVCGEASSSPSALEAMRTLRPDVALLDISLPGTNGIELIKLMKAEQPNLPLLMLSMHDESLYALRALRAGALGYVMKVEALTHVLAALRKVLKGEIYVSPEFSERLIFQAVQSVEGGMGSPVDKLSDRELEVLELLGRGLGTKAIADQLHLSVKTIETHRAHIKEKLGFKDASEMVRFAIEWVAQEKGS